ncbi:hypothetical protein ALT721_2490032 [Alteromonas alvinellae]
MFFLKLKAWNQTQYSYLYCNEVELLVIGGVYGTYCFKK